MTTKKKFNASFLSRNEQKEANNQNKRQVYQDGNKYEGRKVQ